MRDSDEGELSKLTRQELTSLIIKLQDELGRKKKSLTEARSRLLAARKRISGLRDTVEFQRKRIMELYRSQKVL